MTVNIFNGTRGKLLIGVVLFSALLCVALILSPIVARRILIKKVHEACPRCTLDIQDVDLNLLSGTFAFNGIKFRYEEKGYLEIDWTTESFSSDIDVLAALRGNVFLGKILTEKTVVQLLDGDGPEAPEEKEVGPMNVLFRISGVEIKDAEFHFVQKIKHTRSKLDIFKINGEVGEAGNVDGLKTKPVHATGKGSIENSGWTAVNIYCPIFERPVRVDMDAAAANYELSALTPFFKENAGVSLLGHLIEGTGEVHVLGNQARASVWAKFKDFDVKIDKTYERSALMKFFLELGTAITFDDKNFEKKKSKQRRSVVVMREKDESIPAFILRSLKDAAIAVVSVD